MLSSSPRTHGAILYYYLLDLIGVAVFAVGGALAAGRRGLDLIGVVIAAGVTAVGGGTIRDLLLDRHPIFWLVDAWYLLVILGATVATILYVRWARVPGIALDLADALGLALFTMTGTQIAEGAGMPAISSVLLGAITGAAGGVIRDVLLVQVPHILQRGSLYATAAIAGASLYLGLIGLGVGQAVSSLVGMACVAVIRLVAISRGIKLPAFEVQVERDD